MGGIRSDAVNCPLSVDDVQAYPLGERGVARRRASAQRQCRLLQPGFRDIGHEWPAYPDWLLRKSKSLER